MYVQRSLRPSVVKRARTRWPGQSRLFDVEPDCPRALPNLTPPPHRARHRPNQTDRAFAACDQTCCRSTERPMSPLTGGKGGRSAV